MVINPDTWTMPKYDVYFPLGYINEFVEDIYNQVNSKIKMGMNYFDIYILTQAIINSGNGNHLEIGSLFGGSAIIAALTKKEFDIGGSIYCIDDTKATGKDYITDNLKLFGVNDRVSLHIGKSNPFPLQQRFSSALIDAGHDYQSCITDWNNVKQVTDKYIIIHDYDPGHPGVVKASREAMQEWVPVHLSEHSLVLGKI